ncbi:MAG: exonuclease SbcCD subunit D [Lachnospiraceae bacterium]|jgi:exonuclease SbcD|nr:exonuclease SbcCD subunit D [Lachnospiraceae bacterium]
MKFLHLADLHFGKSIYGVSLLEKGDQPVWVERFLQLVCEIQPDVIVIAGDVYDRSSPSGEAVALLDSMITDLAEKEIPVIIVAGNHDSGQRLSFGGSLLAKQRIHISGVLSKELPCVTLSDQEGPVNFWLMPYIFPSLVAQRLEDESIRDYDTAVRRLLELQKIDFSQRNVLIAHQNVTANGQESTRGGSESMVGGVGQVDYSVFEGFDYVALGHIHSSYPVGRETIRYAGSPLCYHFNETKQPVKGPILVELGAKGTLPNIETKSIEPLHPMREIRGAYETIRAEELQNTTQGEYVRIVLTDRRNEPNIYHFFRELFEKRGSVVMEVTSEYNQFQAMPSAAPSGTAEELAIEELFAEFYTERFGGKTPDPQEQELLRFAGEQMRQAESDISCQAEELRKFALEQEDAE